MLQTISVTPDTYNKIQKTLCSIETTLQQSLLQVTDLDSEFNLLRTETERYKTELLSLKEKCDKHTCSGSEALSKVIETKDCTLSSIVSTLKKYLNTNDINYLNEVFKLLCIERTDITPPKGSQDKNITPQKRENMPVESATFTMEISLDSESISEIEGTPTGRTSPIIQPRLKSTLSSLLNGTESIDKKKCPEHWPTPPKKTSKTANTSARGKTRMRQQRLNLSKLRSSAVVDLTSSPEFSGGMRTLKTDSCADIKPIIKPELLANDDLILPSPTSDPTVFSSALYKTVSKNSPAKKKPSLKLKRESDENEKKHKCDGVTMLEFTTNMEESINLLNQQPNRFKKPTVMKIESHDPDQTNCDNLHNMSILKEVNKLEIKRENLKQQEVCVKSPTKRPLAENINTTNVDCNLETSQSLLHTDVDVPSHPTGSSDHDRQLLNQNKEIIEPVYKEPTLRKKVEKRALPGWSCDQCRIFYDVLYQNEPEMLEKLMNECSKHRGKKNPARPKTPEGFWNPRWSVPDNTEEFNRQNNVA